MNKVQILGTITRDIELKYAQSGSAKASFGIAYNDTYKQQDGTKKEVVHFFDCTAFGRTGEVINQFFKKGSRILIDGSLDYQSWTAQDGSKKSKVGIKVNGIDFIDKKQQDAPAQTPQGANPPRNDHTQQKQAYEVIVEDDFSSEIPF